jgi:lipid-A-disaccharide synthase
MPSSILFIAGDPSGDNHASTVIRSIHEEFPGIELWGIGGPAMENEGFVPVMPFAPFNRMGYLEVATHIGFFLSAQKKLIALMEQRRPSALVCVDYSGFNIPMMKAARKLGIPVLWYIAPMVWAWKRKRAAVVGMYASHIATIFPFEVPYFTGFKAKVSFVGNPTVEAMERSGCFAKSNREHPGNGSFRLAIVPGSRRHEIEQMLPRMIAAFLILRQRFPYLRACVSRYGALPAGLFRELIGEASVEVFEGPLREMLGRSDCAFVASGTATLETALLGIPLIVTYHASFITHAIFKHFIQIPYIGLPNIIAGEAIVPECIQEQAEPANLALTLERFIVSPKLFNTTVAKLVALREKLGEKKPSCEVMEILKPLIERGNKG